MQLQNQKAIGYLAFLIFLRHCKVVQGGKYAGKYVDVTICNTNTSLGPSR